MALIQNLDTLALAGRAGGAAGRRPPNRNRNMLGGQGVAPEMMQPAMGMNPQASPMMPDAGQQQADPRAQLLAGRMANFRRGSSSGSYQSSPSEQLVNQAYDTMMPGIQSGLSSLMSSPQSSRRGSTSSSSSSWGVPYNQNDTGAGVFPNSGPGSMYSGYGSDSDYDSDNEGQPYGMPQPQQAQPQQQMQPQINASPASMAQQGTVQSLLQPQFGTFPQAMASKRGVSNFNPYPGNVPSYAQYGKASNQPGFDMANNQADWDSEYTRQVNEYNQSRQSLDPLRPKSASLPQPFRFGGPQRPTTPYQVGQPAMATQMENPLNRLMQTGMSQPAAQPQMMNAVKVNQAAQDAQYKKAGVNNLNMLKNGGGQQQQPTQQKQQNNQGGAANNAGNQANQNQSDKIKMGKTKYDWLEGQEPYGMRLPILSDEQIQTMHRLLPGFEQKVGGNQYDFEPVAQSMRDEMNRSVLPALANRFSAFGGGLSTDAYQNAAARALTDNEMNIGKMRGQYNLQKNAQDQSALSTLLGQQYETMYFPGQTGLYEDAKKAIPGVLQKAGELIAEKMLGGSAPGGGSWTDFFNGPIDKIKSLIAGKNATGAKLTSASGQAALDEAVNNPEVQAALQSSDPKVRKSAQDAVAAVTAAVAKNWGAWTGAGIFAAIAVALGGGAYLVDQYQNPADSPEKKKFDDHQKDMKGQFKPEDIELGNKIKAKQKVKGG